MATEAREQFDEELDDWIRRGWLQPYHGEAGGVIPLMAVMQASKAQVPPVLDFRELNNLG
jgi:hypothetical protein